MVENCAICPQHDDLRTPARQLCDGIPDLARRIEYDEHRLEAMRPAGIGEERALRRPIRIRRLEHADALESREQLLKDGEILLVDLRPVQGKPGDVAAWFRKVRDQSAADRIARPKNDRNGLCRSLR